MDLANLKTTDLAEAGAKLILTNPYDNDAVLYGDDEQTKPMAILIKGRDSTTYKSIMSEIFREQRALAKENKEMTLEESSKLTIEKFARLTIGFENLVMNGKELKFSHEEAVKLYTSCDWMVKQLDEFVSDGKNFIKG
jgi:lipoate-protein ligase A